MSAGRDTHARPTPSPLLSRPPRPTRGPSPALPASRIFPPRRLGNPPRGACGRQPAPPGREPPLKSRPPHLGSPRRFYALTFHPERGQCQKTFAYLHLFPWHGEETFHPPREVDADGSVPPFSQRSPGPLRRLSRALRCRQAGAVPPGAAHGPHTHFRGLRVSLYPRRMGPFCSVPPVSTGRFASPNQQNCLLIPLPTAAESGAAPEPREQHRDASRRVPRGPLWLPAGVGALGEGRNPAPGPPPSGHVRSVPTQLIPLPTRSLGRRSWPRLRPYNNNSTPGRGVPAGRLLPMGFFYPLSAPEKQRRVPPRCHGRAAPTEFDGAINEEGAIKTTQLGTRSVETHRVPHRPSARRDAALSGRGALKVPLPIPGSLRDPRPTRVLPLSHCVLIQAGVLCPPYKAIEASRGAGAPTLCFPHGFPLFSLLEVLGRVWPRRQLWLQGRFSLFVSLIIKV